MKMPQNATQFAVIGLGRFGQSIVRTLAGYGVNVLACDRDEERLRAVTGYATHVVLADAEDDEALAKLGIGDFDVVVMAMGGNFQASIMATMAAKEQGAKYVIVKADGYREKKIFESVGASLVIMPEHEMGAKLAHRLVHPHIVDLIENIQNYQITEMHPLEEWVGKAIEESDIRKNFGMSVLAIIRGKKTIIPVSPDEILQAEDILVTLGDAE